MGVRDKVQALHRLRARRRGLADEGARIPKTVGAAFNFIIHRAKTSTERREYST